MKTIYSVIFAVVTIASFCHCEMIVDADGNFTVPVLNGTVQDANKVTCMRYQFSVKLEYLDEQTKNKTELYIPKNYTVVSNNCTSNSSEYLMFKFDNSTFNLTMEQDNVSVYLTSIAANINFPKVGWKNFSINNPTPNFKVDKTHSYVCANDVTIKANDQLQLVFSNLKLQAFMKPTQNGTFAAEHNCQNEINDIVPIAVGAALTLLVIIVMIAYFIARRRSRRLAYQSV